MLLRNDRRKSHMLVQAHDSVDIQPTPEVESDAVRAQLELLLHSAHFKNSKRYPTLLRYIVEETLEGRGAQLKERVLGVEVFGRLPDYDTSADPIVRVTVAEIRKRIAQYYHEDAHHSELRIELTPGSYLPEFLHGRESTEEVPQVETTPFTAPVPSTATNAPADLALSETQTSTPAGKLPRARLWLGVAAMLLAIAGVVSAWRWLRPPPMEQLWAPVFAIKGPITFCLPMSVKKNGIGKASTTEEAIAHAMDLADQPLPEAGTFFDHELAGENVVYSDVQAMMKLESIVEQQRRPVRVRLNFGTNLNELREGPVILIGGLDNQWTLKQIAPLRFRFAGSDADQYYIQDAKAPEKKDWSVRLHDKYVAMNRDYAIIARTHSEAMGQVIMIAAGVGMSGTAAAGEFLANPSQVAELQRRIGPAFRDHDFEAVLSTDVVNGIAGKAKIIAFDVQ